MQTNITPNHVSGSKGHKLNQLSQPQTRSQLAEQSQMRLNLLLQFQKQGVTHATLRQWFKR